MQNGSVPNSVLAFLSAHGRDDLVRDGLTDLPGLTGVFRAAVPPADTDPLSDRHLTFLTAVLDCIGIMNEQLYEHYRAMIDLFRDGILRIPRDKLLSSPAFDGLREKAVGLGLLPEDLFGQTPSRPHIGVPDAYIRIREGCR